MLLCVVRIFMKLQVKVKIMMKKCCCLKSFGFIQIQDLYFLKLILPFTDPIMAKARKKRITGPALAINCGLDHPGLVQVGDPVYAVISSSN
jgi:hypothetical protein